MDWTTFKRDPLKELSEACHQAGIRFCVYYSHREDWEHADGYGNNWDYDRSKKNFARYLEEKSKPQLRELLTNYEYGHNLMFFQSLELAPECPLVVE